MVQNNSAFAFKIITHWRIGWVRTWSDTRQQLPDTSPRPGQTDPAHEQKVWTMQAPVGWVACGCQDTGQGKSKRVATLVSRQPFNLLSVLIPRVASASLQSPGPVVCGYGNQGTRS